MPPFTVMTWNLENLFPVGHPSGPKSSAIYEQKMKNIAHTVLGIRPDLLGVQEIGDPKTFADFQRRLRDQYPYTALSNFPDIRGIRVGYLSRLPLVELREMSEFPKTSLVHLADSDGTPILKMGRGLLKATVVVRPGLTVTVVNVHLKSKLITYPGGRRYPLDENERARETALALIKRTAEAVAVRNYLNFLVANNSDPAVLLGDLNDGGEALSTQLMLGPTDRSLERRDKFDDVRLYLLDEYIPAPRRFSRIYQKKGEMIDHIAVSHELIFRLRQVDSYIEPIDNIDAELETRREAGFPDHAPVYARLDVDNIGTESVAG
jgi:endonuclease/exonuclease/phosphatase family metal-dependent hydrolase